MHTQLCLVADIGTSSVKAGILNAAGQLVTSSRAEIHYPDDKFDLLHPEELRRAFRHAVHQLESRSRITAVAISGNGPTLVPVDHQGCHLDTVLMWLDRRDISCAPPGDRSFFLPKAAWLRQHEPAVFDRTRSLLSCAEFIGYQLTGELHTASPSGDFDHLFWDDDAIAACGFSRDLFPRFCRPAERVGDVRDAAARDMGIPADTPLFAAGSDFLMSLLGTAAIDVGVVCDRAGSSEGINYCSDRDIQDPRLRTLPHVIPGFSNVAGILSSTGLLFEWFRRFTGMQGVSYHDMLHMIAGARSPAPWFFPTLHAGASWEFHHGMFYGLGAGHGAAEMGRAVVDSIGFAVRETVDILRSVVGEIAAMRACGGQARNAVWNQMKADIAGVAIDIPAVPEAELVGNAACCFAGLGLYADIAEASRSMVSIVKRYEPDPAEHERCSEQYQAYTAVYTALRGVAAEQIGGSERFR